MTAYIYAIKAIASGRKAKVKFGITTDTVESRKRDLQTGCPYPLLIHSVYTVASQKTALNIERYIHGRLAKCNTVGEWFLVPHDKIGDIFYELINNYFAEKEQYSKAFVPIYYESWQNRQEYSQKISKLVMKD